MNEKVPIKVLFNFSGCFYVAYISKLDWFSCIQKYMNLLPIFKKEDQ